MNAADAPKSPYDVLRPLMRRFGASGSPEAFYWAVNHAYHAAESSRYDVLHGDMFRDEERVWERLLQSLAPASQPLVFLDVGCGTGLVGHFVARFLPDRVAAMHLLDPSSAMLSVVREKAKGWPFPTVLHEGDLFSLPSGFACDVVTVNSVLHHVVDLPPFLRALEQALRPGGHLLAAHDPRAGAGDDAVLERRRRAVADRLQRSVPPLRRLRRWIAPRLRSAFGLQRSGSLEAATNRPLLEKGVIRKPMSAKAIWAVTDFHVPGQPGNFGAGISLSACAPCMPSMRLAQSYTYRYHEAESALLTEEERRMEDTWWAQQDPHGAEVASVWTKIPPPLGAAKIL